MVSDFWLVARWWGMLFLVGAAAFPLTKALFGEKRRGNFIDDRQQNNTVRGWWDHGYLFSKAVGMAAVTWMVYVMGTAKVLPFGEWSIVFSLITVFLFGIALHILSSRPLSRDPLKKKAGFRVKPGMTTVGVLLLEEVFFFVALLVWSWVKAHEPSIRGLEKFMDFGFMQSILNSQYFPPADMWYPPLPINYYYFGHLVTAVLTKLSGIDLIYTFNLMLATIFALTLTMSFSIGYQLMQLANPKSKAQMSNQIQSSNDRKQKRFHFGFWKFDIGWDFGFRILDFAGGALTAFLVTLAGNMQTIYAFTRGYTGDDVKPFWQLFWKIGPESPPAFWVKEMWVNLLQGMNTYWYANATRFIPFSIHEFPSYSFVVSDVHGHVLSIPFVLLAIALLIRMFGTGIHRENFQFIFYGFLVGVLLMTNALDGPIYLALFVAVLGISMRQRVSASMQNRWKEFVTMVGVVVLVAGVTSLPFLFHFKSFVTGIAVNCPPEFLSNTKIGPLLFEGVEKCQRSPLWMLWILWGFFVYCGLGLIAKLVKFGKLDKLEKIEKMLLIFFFFSIALIIFPEFFYFKDIYPMHFRSNTMFKLGYQAFILLSIVAGYTIVNVISDKKQVTSKKLFLVFLLPQLFLVSIFPIFSVRSYFNGLKTYQGLDGLAWMQKEYPDDWAGIEWLRTQIPDPPAGRAGLNDQRKQIAIVEADGDSYTDYARVSAFTGIPTIIGWGVHEWLWRGSYDVVAPRRTDVQQVYESTDLEATRTILTRFGVRYVIVGQLERQKYPNMAEWKFGQLGKIAFQQGQTTIYQVE